MEYSQIIIGIPGIIALGTQHNTTQHIGCSPVQQTGGCVSAGHWLRARVCSDLQPCQSAALEFPLYAVDTASTTCRSCLFAYAMGDTSFPSGTIPFRIIPDNCKYTCRCVVGGQMAIFTTFTSTRDSLPGWVSFRRRFTYFPYKDTSATSMRLIITINQFQ